MDVFEFMQTAGKEPNLISYNSLITACAKGVKTKEALDAFKSMQAAGEEPDIITYSSLIKACAKGVKTQVALDVFKSMQAVGQEPNVISYDSLITACAPSCEHGNQGFADEWLFEEGCRTDKRRGLQASPAGGAPPVESFIPSYLHRRGGQGQTIRVEG